MPQWWSVEISWLPRDRTIRTHTQTHIKVPGKSLSFCPVSQRPIRRNSSLLSYVSYSQDPRSNQHPGAYDHAPLTNPPITQPAEWHLPERPVGFDGLPVFPARPPQPYIPRYMNEREAALLQSAPRYETQQLTGPGHLSYLDTPAYNPASRSYPYQPDTRHLIPRPTCQRCGQSNCLCNRSRPCSRPPSVANSMCQSASGAGCMYPTKTAELITEQVRSAALKQHQQAY